MRVSVDEHLCSGQGRCYSLSPELFTADDEGFCEQRGTEFDVPAGLEEQADLGVRVHRNRPLDELSPQATEVLQTALRRAAPNLIGPSAVLVRPGLEPLTPMISVVILVVVTVGALLIATRQLARFEVRGGD